MAGATQDRDTQLLPGELQRASKQLEAFLGERMKEDDTAALG